MTFWHLSAFFNEHLAHLPCPVTVTSLSAAKAEVAKLIRHNAATPLSRVSLVFIRFSLSFSRLLRFCSDTDETANQARCSRKKTVLRLKGAQNRPKTGQIRKIMPGIPWFRDSIILSAQTRDWKEIDGQMRSP